VRESLSENQESVSDGLKQEGAYVTIREFVSDPSLGLDIELFQGEEGLDNKIRSPRIQKLGMALAGFTDYIHQDRVQFIGSSEIDYLRSLEPEESLAAIRRLKNYRICCILITKGLEIPEEILRISKEKNIPILRSGAQSSDSVSRIVSYLEKRLAPRMTIHGVLIEIFGLGVLILGPSGIGKSECALELVLKGHRLVTDDSIEITRNGIDRISGSGGPVLKHHMELRGLGIINIKELLGISATSVSQNIDFAVRLERWNQEADYDRLGLEHDTIEFLGISIPLIAMPVAPGRNVATLIEVAARIHLLRQRGYRPSKEIS
jgi:HPr kinase/phosphorylase